MMKKDLLNKQVVRAISLGLSAVMLTTPMTALAAEGEEVDTTPGTEPTEAEVEQNTVVADTTDAINEAQKTISNAEEGNNVEVVLETPVALPSTGEKIVIVPDAVEAAGNDDLSDVKTTVGEGEDAEEITYDTVIGEATEEVNTGLLGTNAELEDAENALSDVADAEADAKQDVADANTIIDEINANNTAVKDANDAAQAAADKAEEALKEAQAATTEAAAQAAVDKAEEAFNEATAAQADAQVAYDANVEKLAAAEAELVAAEANLAKAKAAAETTVEELAAAHAAVSAAADNAAALKAQVDADAEALANSKEAALKAAYDNMMAQSVSKQYTGSSAKAEDADEDGIGDEFTTEFGSESASSAYWTAADKYFELYLKYIYGDNYVSGKWEKNNKTLENPQKAYDAEVDNTFIVIYKDENGVEQTAYYNYHTDVDKDDKGDITIYEKQKATGKTEEVWGTEEFEDTRLVDKVVVEQEEKTVTSSEDALSIKNADDTYTKLADVQKEGDVVLTTGEAEDGTATSVLVKDANSQLLDSDEADLDEDTQKIVENTYDESYSVETYVTYEYGTKEERVDYADRIGSYDDLEEKYNAWLKKYPTEDGYRVEIVFDHGFGDDETITLEQAEDMELGSILGAMWDCGFELKAYQTVEDTDNIVGQSEQQVIVKTTTATVATTENGESKDDGYLSNKKAKQAMEKEIAKLEAEGYTITNSSYGLEGIFDGYGYEIEYTKTTTSTQTVKTEKYSATEYNMNTITTTTTELVDVEKTIQVEETFTNTRDVLLEEAKDYEYWTERRNTSNDDDIKKAMAGYVEAAEEMKAKQDAAAIALAAALQAKADVEKAQAELDELEVDDSACIEAAKKLAETKAAYEKAADDLEAATQAAEDAEDAFEEAAEELDRFIPTPGAGGDDAGDDGDDDATPTTPVVVPVVTPEEIPTATVTPVAGGAGAGAGAGAAVVDIEDEETPLAAGIDNGNGDGDANGGDGEEVLVAGAEEETAIVAIEDEETPLAAGSGADAKMSWWWLLIVALLGATGYKMYKDHQKKKEEAAQEA